MKSLLQRVFALSLCIAPAIYGHCGFKFAEDYETGQRKLIKYEGYDDIVNIPSTTYENGEEYKVTSIGEHAFEHNKYVSQVILGRNIQKIEYGAFSGCINLNHIVFDFTKNLSTIEENAFSSCPNLTYISLPSCLTRVGTLAFWNCYNLNEVWLPVPQSSLKLESEAFSGCSGLTTVKCFSTDPSKYQFEGNFFPNPENIKLFVPTGSTKAYNKDAKWSTITNVQEWKPKKLSLFNNNMPEASYVNSAETKSVTIPLMPGYAITKSAAGVTKHVM